MDKTESKVRCIELATEIMSVSKLTAREGEEGRASIQEVLHEAKKLYSWLSSERKDEE